MEWKWSKANEKSLAQFVSDRAVELLPKLSSSPFDLVQTRDGRLKLVQSIYNQLLMGRGDDVELLHALATRYKTQTLTTNEM